MYFVWVKNSFGSVSIKCKKRFFRFVISPLPPPLLLCFSDCVNISNRPSLVESPEDYRRQLRRRRRYACEHIHRSLRTIFYFFFPLCFYLGILAVFEYFFPHSSSSPLNSFSTVTGRARCEKTSFFFLSS